MPPPDAPQRRRRHRRPRIGRAVRCTLILLVLLAVAGAVLWIRREFPSHEMSFAQREAPAMAARSLDPVKKALPPVAVTTPPNEVKDMAAKLATLPPQAEPPPQQAQDSQALKEWPREVALAGTPEVTIVSQDEQAGEFIYRTRHFEYSCDAPLGPDVVRHFARAFEATYLLNCLLPLDLKPAPEPLRKLFQARILSNDAAFAATGAPPGSGGFYSRGDKRVYVPASSLGVKLVGGRVMLDQSVESNDTLIHEITHQMMGRWLPLLPVWLTEGSAEYAGAADFVHGRFFLGQMQDRLKHYLRGKGARQMGGSVRFAMLKVAELLALDGPAWAAGMTTPVASENYASALLLTFYLYHLDRSANAAGVIACLRAVEQGMPHEQAVRDFILAGRRPDDFEREMGLAYAGIGVELQFTRRGGAVFKP